jgi:hypothetical protein
MNAAELTKAFEQQAAEIKALRAEMQLQHDGLYAEITVLRASLAREIHARRSLRNGMKAWAGKAAGAIKRLQERLATKPQQKKSNGSSDWESGYRPAHKVERPAVAAPVQQPAAAPPPVKYGFGDGETCPF